MAGMSARMKAKKGRFGVGGLVPTISILSPANNTNVSFGAAVGFVAEANDDINGNVSANITWSNDYDGQTATGAKPSFTFAFAGSPVVPTAITLTAQYTDGTTAVTDTVIVNAT